MIRQVYKRVSAWLARHGDHHYLGRYSVVKLEQFDEYQQNTSRLRVLLVLLFTPLPTFLALIAMDTIPMNNPSAGPRHNVAAFVRSTLSHILMTFMTLLPLKQALSLSDRRYSFKIIACIVCIACCTGLTVEGLCIPLAFAWEFPVPFRESIGLPVWCTSVLVYNYVFAHRTMRRLWRRHKLQLYVPIVGVQVTLFYFFLGLSAGFAHLPFVPQMTIILTFPFLKVGLKQLIWKYARELDDISTDVSIVCSKSQGRYIKRCVRSL